MGSKAARSEVLARLRGDVKWTDRSVVELRNWMTSFDWIPSSRPRRKPPLTAVERDRFIAHTCRPIESQSQRTRVFGSRWTQRSSPGAMGVSLTHCCRWSALSRSHGWRQRYCLIVDSEEEAAFWRPHLGPRQAVIVKKGDGAVHPDDGSRLVQGIRASSRRHAKYWLNRVRQRLAVPSLWRKVPVSEGFYESIGYQVMHFTFQRFALCALPSIYNPHDLQHLRYPQFFTPSDLAWRETVYPFGCRIAQTVIVGSQWAKDDFSRQYSCWTLRRYR